MTKILFKFSKSGSLVFWDWQLTLDSLTCLTVVKHSSFLYRFANSTKNQKQYSTSSVMIKNVSWWLQNTSKICQAKSTGYKRALHKWGWICSRKSQESSLIISFRCQLPCPELARCHCRWVRSFASVERNVLGPQDSRLSDVAIRNCGRSEKRWIEDRSSSWDWIRWSAAASGSEGWIHGCREARGRRRPPRLWRRRTGCSSRRSRHRRSRRDRRSTLRKGLVAHSGPARSSEWDPPRFQSCKQRLQWMGEADILSGPLLTTDVVDTEQSTSCDKLERQ